MDILCTRPRAIFPKIILLWLILSSCGKSSVPTPTINNLKTLKSSLQQAGVTIREGDKIPADLFNIQGQVLFINGGEIEVYEFQSQKEREIISGGIKAEGRVVEGEMIPWDTRPTVWGSGSLIVLYRGYDGGIILLLSGLIGDPITYEAPAEDQPYPPAVAAAIHYLSDELQVDPGSIRVLDFEEVDWKDSCLEVPKPEEECILTMISGWRILFEVSTSVYELRTDTLGQQVRQP